MSIGNPRRLIGRVPELGKEWQEVTPELKEFLTKLAQAVSDPDDSTADLGAAIAFFMAGSFAGSSGGFGGAGAPITAEYLVGASNGTLTAERVVTNTAEIIWDLSTPGQAKANVGAITTAEVTGLTTAEIVLGVADANLPAGRVVTDNTEILWDLTTPGELKATVGLIETSQVNALDLYLLDIDGELTRLQPESDQMILASRIFGG